jgi:sulfide:quinone oxidoreductase
MAAARKQVVVVADQIMAKRSATTSTNLYDGYGACPLTVAKGRVVLAEFGYGGRLLPTFPAWINRATSATRFGWLLKKRIMPWVYWNLMAKGREWLTRTNPEK